MKTIRNFESEQMALLNALAKKLGREPGEEWTAQSLFMQLLESVKRDGMTELIHYIETETDFLTAPASTRFHGNYEKGLLIHSLLVYILLSSKNKQYHLGLSDDSLIICALMHDLCKCNFYGTEYKNKKVYKPNGSKSDAAGRFDWETVPCFVTNDQFPLGHGEKSLSLVQDFIKLSETEKMLIRWHMGPFASKEEYGFNNAIEWEPAVCAMYTADLEASNLFELKMD